MKSILPNEIMTPQRAAKELKTTVLGIVLEKYGFDGVRDVFAGLARGFLALGDFHNGKIINELGNDTLLPNALTKITGCFECDVKVMFDNDNPSWLFEVHYQKKNWETTFRVEREADRNKEGTHSDEYMEAGVFLWNLYKEYDSLAA